ncbi:phage holin family protein [bacterium]|nr:MAG: phage holin family protein [bacterium]RKZ17409.1 MAG: phage holin family protein [bacterium]
MTGFWRHWAISAVALAVTSWLLPGVHVEGLLSLLIAAVILGFLNAVVKPLFVILTLPATIITLGLFYFVLNGIFFGLAAGLVPGFAVAGFGWAMGGAFAMGFVSNLVSNLFPGRGESEC